MRKDSNSPRQVRVRLLDRLALATSTCRHVDGIWIGSWGRSPEDLTRVEGALSLIRQQSPLDYARIVRDLDRIWVNLTFHGVGEYWHSINACVLDERYVADPAISIEEIASTIVHEATHAGIERCGIRYSEELRKKIEAICRRRELAFVARLPDSAELQQDIARSLEWSQASSGQFSDAWFRESHATGGTEVLRHLGAPEWVARAMLISKPMIDRVRKFSPMLASAVSVVFAIVITFCFAIASILNPKAWSMSKPRE